MMDEKIDIPEKRYMGNSNLIDELGDASEFDAFLRGEKEKSSDGSSEIDQTKNGNKLQYVEKGNDYNSKVTPNGIREPLGTEQDKSFLQTQSAKTGVPNDDEYFASLDPEQLKWYEDKGPEITSFNFESRVNCTSCNKPVETQIGSLYGITRHPLLGVVMCLTCRRFYKDGSGWAKDDDGCDAFCRWCGQGGELILCDKCPAAFCKRCMQRNLGREKITNITNSEEWGCLVCEPKQIYDHKARYFSLYRFNKIPGIRKSKVKEKRYNIAKRKSNTLSRKAEKILQSPHDFIEENIGEAFKTLSVYQKCLEKERKRWIKNGRKMDVDIVTSISKSLRKIYAITKQNMDLLDKAVVQSYLENFPDDSTKIYTGNAALNMSVKPKRQRLKNFNKKPTKDKSGKSKLKDIITVRGKPVYANPEDINNNIESHNKDNSNQFGVQRTSDTLYKLFIKHKPVVPESDSDWSDL